MSILTQFNFDNNRVRVILIDNEPWFVARDIAKVFEYADPGKMVNLVDDEDTQTINPQKLEPASLAESFGSNTLRVSVVNEIGLYAVILRSNKPEAIVKTNIAWFRIDNKR